MSLLATGVDAWNYFWRSVLSPKNYSNCQEIRRCAVIAAPEFGSSIVMYPPGSSDLAMSLLKSIESFPLPPGVSLKFNAELIHEGSQCKS